MTSPSQTPRSTLNSFMVILGPSSVNFTAAVALAWLPRPRIACGSTTLSPSSASESEASPTWLDW